MATKKIGFARLSKADRIALARKAGKAAAKKRALAVKKTAPKKKSK